MSADTDGRVDDGTGEGWVTSTRLRADFAVRLAELYGTEVPAYNTLVDVSRAVNEDFTRERGELAERLGSIERVTAERHGAIRVGSPRELAHAARVFAGFGMHPVGFYDLRDASTSSVPVVSTAFRPIDPAELAQNPFRVFTSMLTTDDRRFFDESTQRQLEEFIGVRELFPEELLALADRAAERGGLDAADAKRFVHLAAAAFELSDEPIEHEWYRHLEGISAVAADIGGTSSTHVNHLTPRVLDIDDLYARMEALGIAMIDEIQGPPLWDGPNVLLRQTSFRALDEARRFRMPDGEVVTGHLRVRFGEVEQRGVALTDAGRALYESGMQEISRLVAASPGSKRSDFAPGVWADTFPADERSLALDGLGYFAFRAADGFAPDAGPALSLRELVAGGAVVVEPIVYEDFLPRSAAGIFQSNLADDGTRDDAERASEYDMATLSAVIGMPIHDPGALYLAQQEASIAALERELGVSIERDLGC